MKFSVDDPITVLLAHWAAEDPAYERKVAHGEAEVRALELQFGITAPATFRRYLLTACSTADDGGKMDGNSGAWWGLDRLDTVSSGYEHDLNHRVLSAEASTSLIFADYAIWFMAWAVCCGPGENYGRVFVINNPARFVANDFGTFVEQYAKEPLELL